MSFRDKSMELTLLVLSPGEFYSPKQLFPTFVKAEFEGKWGRHSFLPITEVCFVAITFKEHIYSSCYRR